MKTALVFPGQGAQKVGMGKALAATFSVAKQVFEEVDAALGEHFSRIIFEGPQELLSLTENAQPAMVATSIAALRVLEQEAGLKAHQIAHYVAGHSLGEYSALVAAESLSLFDAIQLVRSRGKAMQSAVAPGEGMMAAVLGMSESQLAEIVKKHNISECSIANLNTHEQIVISGLRPNVQAVIEAINNQSTLLPANTSTVPHTRARAVVLDVSAPFHCQLMTPAADAMAELLCGITLYPPTIPIVSNVTAKPVFDPEQMKHLLVQQVTEPVRWYESICCLKANGVTRVLEIGHGKVLYNLIKRIDPDMLTDTIHSPQDIYRFNATAVTVLPET